MQLVGLTVGVPLALYVHRRGLRIEERLTSELLIANLVSEVDVNVSIANSYLETAIESLATDKLHFQDVALDNFLADFNHTAFGSTELSNRIGAYRSILQDVVSRMSLIESFIFERYFVQSEDDIGAHTLLNEYMIQGVSDLKGAAVQLSEELHRVSK